MILIKTGQKECKSKFGDKFFYIFFKTPEGKSAKTCIYTKFGNFSRWFEVLQAPVGTQVEVNYLKGLMVDADNFPRIKKEVV